MIHAATIEIAGIVARVLCRHEKPGAWAAMYPAFGSMRSPDVRIAVVYDDAWPPIRWIAPDTASDEATVEHRRGWARIHSEYYDLVVEPLRLRARLRMAPGFWVGSPLRALWSLLLLERGGLLLRARLAGAERDATLILGGPIGDAGLVAVRSSPDGFVCCPTPFEARTSDAARSMRLAGIHVVDGGATNATPAATVRALSRHLRVERDAVSAERAFEALIALATQSCGADALAAS
jgi:hypothetical protein